MIRVALVACRFLLPAGFVLMAAGCGPNDDLPDDDDSPEPEGCEAQGVADPIEAVEGRLSDGSAFLYATVADARGLVVLFHGGGGYKEDSLEHRIEAVLVAREAQSRGLALVSLDSVRHLEENPDNHQWSTVMNIDPDAGAVNPDVLNTVELIERLRDPDDLGVVSEGAPLVLMGFSNGGSMVSRAAQFMPAAVAVTYISNSVDFMTPGAVRPPMVLVPGENDLDHRASETNAELAAEIEAAGGDVLLISNPAEPVTAGLFTRIPTVDCELSMAIRQSLEDGEWLDGEGMLTRNPKSDTSWADGLPDEATSLRVALQDVLMETYAEHSPSSDWNPQVFDFVDEHME